ncbi:hypothetical protein [Exiguobacterium sp. S90]|uniref:hypothetical protein n=1 Tax=Exiguobacterium sp. S90 TaxID=1221231 RepID=UPI001BE86C3A|nr:hypothetical protein [Exiguobacterium sp. S90]
MKKVFTTEHVREQEQKYHNSIKRLFGTSFIMAMLIALGTVVMNSVVVFLFKFLVFVVVVLILSFFYHANKLNFIVKRRERNGEGKKLAKELGIERLTFYKLNDGSLEMHHEPYKKKEIKKMIFNGLSTEEITKKWKEQLLEDFKRLESFIRTQELKGESVIIHTYTHTRMYKTWNKIARVAGIELEVIKGNNQKPVGFKWRKWKKDVYLTSGKVAKKGSIPKTNEWNKYILTSRAI